MNHHIMTTTSIRVHVVNYGVHSTLAQHIDAVVPLAPHRGRQLKLKITNWTGPTDHYLSTMHKIVLIRFVMFLIFYGQTSTLRETGLQLTGKHYNFESFFLFQVL